MWSVCEPPRRAIGRAVPGGTARPLPISDHISLFQSGSQALPGTREISDEPEFVSRPIRLDNRLQRSVGVPRIAEQKCKLKRMIALYAARIKAGLQQI